jgi:hypothetical protein
MTVQLVRVPKQHVRQIWPLVSDLLHRAVKRTDLAHTKDLEADVVDGNGVLWLAIDGDCIEAAATTLLVRTDRNLVCVISACGGSNLENWLPLLAELEAWAKSEGAAKVRIFGRVGWADVLQNYDVKNVVLERLL